MSKNPTITFIGGGNMANSLIGGLIKNRFPCDHIHVADPDQKQLDQLKATFDISVYIDNHEAVAAASVVVLAVKPQVIKAIVENIAASLRQHKPLIISIAAGITTTSLRQWIGEDLPVIRAMPNTPALVQCGATGLFAIAQVNQAQKAMAEQLIKAVGIAIWVEKESEIDIVTAISGSGPAYFLLLMEAMQATAKSMDFDEHKARRLIMQTAYGAAKLALASNESIQDLRRKVTSPGGTTEKAIHTFEQGGFNDLVEKALTAAKDRSIELSTLLGDK